MLVIWGVAMVLLVFIRDLGSSLMFFGAFLAIIYVATNRFSFVADRPGDVRRRRVVLQLDTSATSRTASTRGATRSTPTCTTSVGGSYQIAQSLFAQADGGLFGQGFGAVAAAAAERRGALAARARRPTSSTR